jgi:hypothetical protein
MVVAGAVVVVVAVAVVMIIAVAVAIAVAGAVVVVIAGAVVVVIAGAVVVVIVVVGAGASEEWPDIVSWAVCMVSLRASSTVYDRLYLYIIWFYCRFGGIGLS